MELVYADVVALFVSWSPRELWSYGFVVKLWMESNPLVVPFLEMEKSFSNQKVHSKAQNSQNKCKL